MQRRVLEGDRATPKTGHVVEGLGCSLMQDGEMLFMESVAEGTSVRECASGARDSISQGRWDC
jgi:hypothetical protein